MRRIKNWAVAVVLGLSLSGQAFGQTAGDKVVVIVKQTDLKHEATVVETTYRGNYLTVREVNGNWLWVDSDGTRGWLHRDHVILASRAIDHFTNELRRDPKDDRALIARAVAWQDKDELTNAIRDCTDAIAINAEDPWVYKIRGNAWMAKGEYDIAIADYDQGLRLDPTDNQFYANRGRCHHAKKSYDKAIADYTEAIRLNPKSAENFLGRGSSYYGKEDYDKALADYTMAIELDPKSGSVHNSLAWLLATCPSDAQRNGVRAVELATKAVELAKAAGESFLNELDTLAAAHAEAGHFDEAVKLQQQAVALAPNDNKADFESRLKLFQAGQPYRKLPKAEAVAATAAK